MLPKIKQKKRNDGNIDPEVKEELENGGAFMIFSMSLPGITVIL